MAAAFKDFIQSPQFTFFVGPESKPIVVHAAAIAATSQQLDALINGGMVESETRCAKIEDVEVDDFIRFCEYAYRGDYTIPPWEVLPIESSSTLEKNQQIGHDDGWGSGWGSFPPAPSGKKKKGKRAQVIEDAVIEPEPIPSEPSPMGDYPQQTPEYDEPVPQYKAKPTSRTPLRTRFNNRNYINDNAQKSTILRHFEPKSNTAVEQNFTPVLLAHARLYCFAHLRLIAPLKALTLDKLHKTLMNFKLFTKRVGDIIELARYVYSNPDLPDRGDDGTLNDLRTLVVEYIVCEIDIIGNCDEFVKYMEEGGEFVGDFWRTAREYMV